jgi:hypothetical protein
MKGREPSKALFLLPAHRHLLYKNFQLKHLFSHSAGFLSWNYFTLGEKKCATEKELALKRTPMINFTTNFSNK